jgi:hypothetical protein
MLLRTSFSRFVVPPPPSPARASPDDASDLYKTFRDKNDAYIEVVLKP